MSADSPDLLRLLGAAGLGAASRVRGTSPVTGASSGRPVENSDFAELLDRATSGELSSGVGVTIDAEAGVTLSDSELAKLSVAADRAEAAGIRRAVVLLSGQPLILDVQSRTVVGRAQMENGVLGGIDGVIQMGAAGDGEASAPTLSLPSGFTASNPSLAALLNARRVDQ